MTKIMTSLSGGRFEFGSDEHYPEERPQRLEEVDAFSIDPCAVSNAEFSTFVEATGYVTSAELPLDPASAPGKPPEYFNAGSLVFHMTEGPVDLRDFRHWWAFVPGANWRHPEGPISNIEERSDHPVVQVSLHDAMAYAKWAEKSLPTEKQWEFAARDGVDTAFPWGDSLTDRGRIHANTWHGDFPWQNTRQKSAPFTAPVDAFTPSRYGLFNMIGNVWEWTLDRYAPAHELKTCCTPTRIVDGQLFVVKGGSFLCAPSYCQRYRPSARSPEEARSSTNHLGFRCVKSLTD
jgi:sulfatase modifying factor 1